MSDVRSLVNHLEINTRDELAAQERMLDLLDEQERAIVAGRAEGLLETTRRIEEESNDSVRRAVSRNQILKNMAVSWKVPVEAMTLGSVAERAGDQGAKLSELRSALRKKTSEVIRKNRKIASVANMHRKVVREVIDTILFEGGEKPGDSDTAGSLLDAEA